MADNTESFIFTKRLDDAINDFRVRFHSAEKGKQRSKRRLQGAGQSWFLNLNSSEEAQAPSFGRARSRLFELFEDLQHPIAADDRIVDQKF